MRVPDDPDQPKGRTLVQYSSDRAVSRLDPAFLGNHPSLGDPNITWHVRTIRELCQEELGRELAQSCLAELSALAGKSKAGFWDTLQQQFQAQSASPSPQNPDTNLQTPDPYVFAPSDSRTIDEGRSDVPEPNVIHPTSNALPPSSPMSPPFLNKDMVNPPNVQKVIVEHFICNDSTPSSYSQRRIRTFSG